MCLSGRLNLLFVQLLQDKRDEDVQPLLVMYTSLLEETSTPLSFKVSEPL